MPVHPVEARAAEARARANAKFWKLHGEYKAIEAETIPKDRGASGERYWQAAQTRLARLIAAEKAMLMQEVFSAACVFAKVVAAGDAPQDYELPEPIGNAQQAILNDLERLAKLEMLRGEIVRWAK